MRATYKVLRSRLVLSGAAGLFLLSSGIGSALAAMPLVDSAWVKANIGKPDVVFLDVRGKLAGKSRADYLRGHIPGAVWTNYLKDGWRAKDANGTPGMMAPVAKLEKLIGGLGISNSSHVVIVPNGGKATDMGTGTRIYWTFKVLGHDNVSLLNGGMMAYTRAIDKTTKKPLNPISKGMVKPTVVAFSAHPRMSWVATKEEVKKASESAGMLVDNRPNSQFMGVNRHPKAKRFGTIPGARNLPENWLTENDGGTFRSKSSLVKLYAAAGVPTSGEQITFCNSGHWASIGWFVSHEIMGDKQVRMYDGSMLEWTADKSLPMERKIKL